jgi:predicted metal-dependent hydrolase
MRAFLASSPTNSSMMTDNERSAAARAFSEGIALFNEGRFFTAHEAWEVVWRQAEGTERLLLQGLIQVAAAIIHVERGNLRGARSVYAKACAKLDPLPPNLMGLMLDDFRVALCAFFIEALAGRATLPPIIRVAITHEETD